ncbi:MAG: polar amino acid transport system permease protein [Fusobacteriaceae bacterium]|jgi:polar amino acid transport system permease protein|nr:glnP1 [Fusobacteriales bacterium]MDN5304399.1 polar amino acid transport system permease protein [Fusobacteriaceae bacterium]
MNTIDMTLYILKGLNISAKLYIATFIFTVPISLILAILYTTKYKFIKRIITLYTWVFRGTPLLLQLFFMYYGLPIINIVLSPFTASVLTFVVNYTAYLTEIFRSGIESIDKGQYEASHVLGFTYYQTMKEIIIPQAVRRVLPALSNEAITLVKDTALISAIGMAEILRNSKEIVSREFTIIPFVIATIIYLCISSLIVYIFKYFENKSRVN